MCWAIRVLSILLLVCLLFHFTPIYVAVCNRPGVSRLSSDPCALVSVGTGHYNVHCFVLPLIVLCIISFGAALCSLIHSSLSSYCCPVSCSLYYIGVMCGGPCSSPDY